MKKIITLMLFLTSFAHANNSGPGSQYLKAAEAEDRRVQYFLANNWFSSGDLSKVEYWAQKAVDSGDTDACMLLVQIKITNPVSLDYPQVKVLTEKVVQAGSKEGEVALVHILINTQVDKPGYPKATSLLENASEGLENDSVADAQMLLGLIYANGVGIKVDDDKATWHFKRSPTISQTDYSEYWAGMMFLNDEEGFIKKNKQKVLHWLNLSCMEGFDTGCEEFEKLTNG